MKQYDIENKKIKDNIILFQETMADINYISRTKTLGAELEMVKKYISFLKKKYSCLKTKKAAIFLEPQLDTGYPDIVVVEFSSFPTIGWNKARSNLNLNDIKILFYIQIYKMTTFYNIQKVLGFSEDAIKKSINKLFKCNLIYCSKNNKKIRAIYLKSYCRINKIISIEAKIDKWNDAIRQAENNIWFSTESYIMMNKANCSVSIKNACQKRGIGIILMDGVIKTALKSDKRKFPVSYASLQFNELILRYLNKEGD